MQRRENEAVSSLTLELKQLEAELKHVGPGTTAEVDPIKASIQFEMWYLGCLLYQVIIQFEIIQFEMWITSILDQHQRCTNFVTSNAS